MMEVYLGLVIIAMALYSLATSRNLVRVLIALEVVTIGGLFAISPLAAINPAFAFLLIAALVTIAASEVVILAALIYRAYALTKSTEIDQLSEGREI